MAGQSGARREVTPIAAGRRSTVSVSVLLVTLLVAGCGDRSLDDLRSYSEEVNRRPGGNIDPLPPIKPYNVYSYTASGGTDPFKPFFREDQQEAQAQDQDTGISPDFNRNREELEGFPLDGLRMVGTLQREEETWAVVLAADATIHRVQIGNYLGQNHGKIVNIQEDRVDLIEIARDARGRWQERPASLALLEPE